MMTEMIGELLKSGAGAELLSAVQGHGLNPDQAKAAVTATAEGLAQHTEGAGAAGLLSGLLGSGGGGGLAQGLTGLLGGGSAPASGLSALAAPIANVVAQKTGLDANVALAVVNTVLPKLLALVSGGTQQPAASTSEAPSDLLGAIGGLFK